MDTKAMKELQKIRDKGECPMCGGAVLSLSSQWEGKEKREFFTCLLCGWRLILVGEVVVEHDLGEFGP